MDVAEAQTVWRSFLERRRASARTIEQYVGALPRLALATGPLFGPVEVTRSALVQWRASLQKQYDRDQFSAEKIRGDVGALRSMYAALVEAKLYPGNPAAGIPSLSRKSRLPRPMAIDQLELLLARIPVGMFEHINLGGLRDRVMVELFYNGLRNFEVCGLRTDNVSYAEREQTIVLRFVGKGGHEGEVVLNKRSGHFLAAHMLEQFAPNDWRSWLMDFTTDTAPVFRCLARLLDKRLQGVSQPLFMLGTRQFGRRDANRMFAQYRKAAGLPDTLGPHTLRHSCATELLESGEDIRVVQEILRHKSIRTTALYTQVRRGPKATAIEKLPVVTGGVVWNG